MTIKYMGSAEELLGSIREQHGTNTGSKWEPRGTHTGSMWEPHGTHTESMWDLMGTSWLFWIEIPEKTHRVPTDKNRRVPAGNPMRVPDSIPDGSREGPLRGVWLDMLLVCQPITAKTFLHLSHV